MYKRQVFENIQYGKPGASREEVIQAAKQAGAHDFIQELSNGYDTFVGERGVKLSGGQKQRISIARAFLKMCIRDSPSAALCNRETALSPSPPRGTIQLNPREQGGIPMATTVTAAITLLSALLGLAYSLRAVARGPATAKTAVLYLSLIHICKGSRANAGFFLQIAFFHLFIYKHLPELIVTDTHHRKSLPAEFDNISYIITQVCKIPHPISKLNICKSRFYFVFRNQISVLFARQLNSDKLNQIEKIKIVFCFPDRKRSGYRLLNNRWSLPQIPLIV